MGKVAQLAPQLLQMFTTSTCGGLKTWQLQFQDVCSLASDDTSREVYSDTQMAVQTRDAEDAEGVVWHDLRALKIQ